MLYLNGIAIGVIELKNSRVSIGDGIGQLLSSQQPQFHQWFFSTVQIVFAGNDSEGLQYGTIGTEAKDFLRWKEDKPDNTRFKLDKYLLKICEKRCLLEPKHNARFLTLMQQYMPTWRLYRDKLNQLPVRYEEWTC